MWQPASGTKTKSKDKAKVNQIEQEWRSLSKKLKRQLWLLGENLSKEVGQDIYKDTAA